MNDCQASLSFPDAEGLEDVEIALGGPRSRGGARSQWRDGQARFSNPEVFNHLFRPQFGAP